MNNSNEQHDALSAIESALRAARADSFGAGFTDRVMRRMSRAPAASLARSMQRYFTWMTPALVAAILVLAVLNMRTAGRAGFGGALGLEAVTVATAYSFDADSVRGGQ